jgi:nucleotidyltransferase/DNA polymerase involved in DNA repair
MNQVLNQFGAVVERASIDEAYLDLSPVVDRRQGILLLASVPDP